MEIISNNKGGLANRIKSWVSTIKISKRRHTNYKVFWQVLDSYSNNNHILNCKPELLFSNDVFVSGLYQVPVVIGLIVTSKIFICSFFAEELPPQLIKKVSVIIKIINFIFFPYYFACIKLFYIDFLCSFLN